MIFLLFLYFIGAVQANPNDSSISATPPFCDGLTIINSTSYIFPANGTSNQFPSQNINCSWLMNVMVGYYAEIQVVGQLSDKDYLDIRRLTNENQYVLSGSINGLYWMPAGAVVINLQAVKAGNLLMNINVYPLHLNNQILTSVNSTSTGLVIDMNTLITHNIQVNAFASTDPGVSISVVPQSPLDPNNKYLASYFVFVGNTCYGKFWTNLKFILDSSSPSWVSGNVTICSGVKQVHGQLLIQEKSSVTSLETYIVKPLQNDQVSYNTSTGDLGMSYINTNSQLLEINNLLIVNGSNPQVFRGTIQGLPFATLQNNTPFMDSDVKSSVFSIRIKKGSSGSFNVLAESFCRENQIVQLSENTPFHFPSYQQSAGDYKNHSKCSWMMNVPKNYVVRVAMQGTLSVADKVTITKPDGSSLSFQGALYPKGVVVGEGTTTIVLDASTSFGSFGFYVFFNRYDAKPSSAISVQAGAGQLYGIQQLTNNQLVFNVNKSINTFSMSVAKRDEPLDFLSSCYVYDGNRKFLFSLFDVTSYAMTCSNPSTVICVQNVASNLTFGSILVQNSLNINNMVYTSNFADKSQLVSYQTYGVNQATTLILGDNQKLFINNFKQSGNPVAVINSTPEKPSYVNLTQTSSFPFESSSKFTTFLCPAGCNVQFTVSVSTNSSGLLTFGAILFTLLLSFMDAL